MKHLCQYESIPSSTVNPEIIYHHKKSLHVAAENAASNGEKREYVHWGKNGRPRMSPIAFNIHNNQQFSKKDGKLKKGVLYHAYEVTSVDIILSSTGEREKRMGR